jgi:hypothetical protein
MRSSSTTELTISAGRPPKSAGRIDPILAGGGRR